MSNKKRGIMLKSLASADEGMQELINPVPVDLVEEADDPINDLRAVDEIIAEENQALEDVIMMLKDTARLLADKDQSKS